MDKQDLTRFDTMQPYDPLNLYNVGQVQPKHKDIYFKGKFLEELWLRRAFLDTSPVGGEQIAVRPWRYLDVLSTGAINSRNNERVGGAFGDSRLELVFDDGEVHKIRGEVYNLPLVGKQHFVYWNTTTSTAPAIGIESGYNDLIFIFKNYPWLRHVKKNNPTWCKYWELDEDTTYSFWFGERRPNATWEVAIPYIPKIYDEVKICLYVSDAQVRISDFQQYCCDDLQNVCAYSGAMGSGCNVVDNCTARAKLTVQNQDTENKHFACVMVTYIVKTDNN